MGFVKKYKDPDARLDYLFNGADWLPEGDLFTSAIVTVYKVGTTEETDAIVIDDQDFNDLQIIAWIAPGGNAGESYDVTAHYGTRDGREDDCTFTLQLKEK